MNEAWRKQVTGAILAGGEATRLGRVNKALLDLGGESILSRLARTLAGCLDRVLVVSRDPETYRALGYAAVADRFPQRSSLTGLHAALFHAPTPFVFVTACDTPLLRPELLRALLERLEPGDEALVPQWEDGRYEPLCAVYSKACLPAMEEALARDAFRIADLLPRLRTRAVPVVELRSFDPDLASFLNANTPKELEHLRGLAAREGRP